MNEFIEKLDFYIESYDVEKRLYEEGKEDKLIEQVKKLNSDKKEYESFISIPPFKETAPEAIWAMLQEFENRLKNL